MHCHFPTISRFNAALFVTALACGIPCCDAALAAEPDSGVAGSNTSAATEAYGEVPTFRRDVMAVLSKSGCNAGACHGNQHGKGGFKLSLRGQDPDWDYDALTRDETGRRINLFEPERSLVLLKPSGQLAHQGGVRFHRDDVEYQILNAWLSAGAPQSDESTPSLVRLEVAPSEQVLVEPANQVQLAVTAHFSDGTERDVTRLAVYEPSNVIAAVDRAGLVEARSRGETTVVVRYLDRQVPVRLALIEDRPDFVWREPEADNYIDRHVYDKLRTLDTNPSPPAADATFVRRAHLDALGVLPTAEEAHTFVADTHPDKRARLIDQLLARPEFADRWALLWSDLLRNEEKVLDQRGVEVYHEWLRQGFAEGRPLDSMVRELLTATGSTYEVPPANFYRAHRDPFARAETAARLFLGVRLGCAKCHNHPFDRWTQDDYYDWAALFARVDYEIVENHRRDKFDKNEFIGEQVILVRGVGEVKNPRTSADAHPRLLGGETLSLTSSDDRLAPMADWLTSPDNRAFARTQANRIWYHLMGRGLVEPLDDFRATNPASNPPLLDALADDLAANGYSLRHLVRTIMNSRAYQTSAEPNDTNADDEGNFARAVIRRLTAEEMLDAQCQVLGVSAEFAGYDLGTRAGQIAGVQRVRKRQRRGGDGDRFLKLFGKPDRLLACECERSNETTLTQAFFLVGDVGINERLASPGNRLDALARSSLSDAEAVTELYWSALGRSPSDEEVEASLAVFAECADRFTALQDIAWALLNSKEFLFRR